MSYKSQSNRSKGPQSSVALSKGSVRRAGDAAGETYADKKAKALAAKNTVVMGYDELERIKAMCSQTNE